MIAAENSRSFVKGFVITKGSHGCNTISVSAGHKTEQKSHVK